MNEYISYFSELNLENVAETGGKGANLCELVHVGFPVPPGFCVKIQAFDTFLSKNYLDKPISDIASTIDYSSVNDVDIKNSENHRPPA